MPGREFESPSGHIVWPFQIDVSDRPVESNGFLKHLLSFDILRRFDKFCQVWDCLSTWRLLLIFTNHFRLDFGGVYKFITRNLTHQLWWTLSNPGITQSLQSIDAIRIWSSINFFNLLARINILSLYMKYRNLFHQRQSNSWMIVKATRIVLLVTMSRKLMCRNRRFICFSR